MSSAVTAEKLGFKDGEIRDLKLGKSFRPSTQKKGHHTSSKDTFSNGSGESFHSIRYDFKPASVDSSKVAQVDFGQNNKVTVITPNVEGSGQAETVYKGSRKPHLKECVLIINHDTGEITLERLGHQITVKKTRAEGSSKARQSAPPANVRPPTPTTEGRRSPARSGGKNSSAKGSSVLASSSSRGSNHQSQTFVPASNGSGNGRQHSPPSSSTSQNVQTPNSSMAISSSSQLSNDRAHGDDVTMLSASSSDDSDSNDSSSSDEENETARRLESSLTSGSLGNLTASAGPPATALAANGSATSPNSAMSDSSDNDSSSSSSSDDSDDDDGPSGRNVASPVASSNGHSNGSLSMPNLSATLSMPSFTQLSTGSRQVTPPLSSQRPGSNNPSSVLSMLPNEDLRLSESDSDSD